jgi:hypothetical protein
MEGVRLNKLYQLSFTTIPNLAIANIVTTIANVATTTHAIHSTDLALISSSHYTDPTLWNERMGHVNFTTMQKMEQEGNLTNFSLPKLKNFHLQHPYEAC